MTVDFDAFQRVLNRPGGFRDPGEPEEYCRGFQVFDKDMTGFIGVGQLKYILTNLGEKMTEEEVDELLKAVDTSSGQINYTGMRASELYSLDPNVCLLTSTFLFFSARPCPNYSRQLRFLCTKNLTWWHLLASVNGMALLCVVCFDYGRELETLGMDDISFYLQRMAVDLYAVMAK